MSNSTKDFSFLVKCVKYVYNNHLDTPSTETWTFEDQEDHNIHADIEVSAGSDYILNKYYILTLTPIVNNKKSITKIDPTQEIYELSKALTHPGYLDEDIDEFCYTLRNFNTGSEIVITTSNNTDEDSFIISNKQGYTIKISEANFVNL
jgi:hypothetical protein